MVGRFTETCHGQAPCAFLCIELFWSGGEASRNIQPKARRPYGGIGALGCRGLLDISRNQESLRCFHQVGPPVFQLKPQLKTIAHSQVTGPVHGCVLEAAVFDILFVLFVLVPGPLGARTLPPLRDSYY